MLSFNKFLSSFAALLDVTVLAANWNPRSFSSRLPTGRTFPMAQQLLKQNQENQRYSELVATVGTTRQEREFEQRQAAKEDEEKRAIARGDICDMEDMAGEERVRREMAYAHPMTESQIENARKTLKDKVERGRKIIRSDSFDIMEAPEEFVKREIATNHPMSEEQITNARFALVNKVTRGRAETLRKTMFADFDLTKGREHILAVGAGALWGNGGNLITNDFGPALDVLKKHLSPIAKDITFQDEQHVKIDGVPLSEFQKSDWTPAAKDVMLKKLSDVCEDLSIAYGAGNGNAERAQWLAVDRRLEGIQETLENRGFKDTENSFLETVKVIRTLGKAWDDVPRSSGNSDSRSPLKNLAKIAQAIATRQKQKNWEQTISERFALGTLYMGNNFITRVAGEKKRDAALRGARNLMINRNVVRHLPGAVILAALYI